MNEGKQKLEAMRRLLKKKVNHQPSQINNNHDAEKDIKQIEEQSPGNKLPIKQRFEDSNKGGENGDKTQTNKSTTVLQNYHENPNSLLLDQPKKSSNEQALEEGQIHEQQNQSSQEKQDLVHAQSANTFNANLNLQNCGKQQQPNITNSQISQKLKEPRQQQSNMEIQQAQPQINQQNEYKNENISLESSDKIIEGKSNQPHQKHLSHQISKNSDQFQENIKSIEQNIVQAAQKPNQGQHLDSLINTSKDDITYVSKVQKQQTHKNTSDDQLLHTTQNLNLQASLSHQSNSIHRSQNRVYPPSNKPAIKVVLKQLQMIKSTIHNLNVTHRGVEYLRQRIKHDSLLKRKIRERLVDLQGDNEMDVLRKLVKHVQSSCSRHTQNHHKSLTTISTKSNNYLSNHTDNLLIANKQLLMSQKKISQPQSNEAIEY